MSDPARIRTSQDQNQLQSPVQPAGLFGLDKFETFDAATESSSAATKSGISNFNNKQGSDQCLQYRPAPLNELSKILKDDLLRMGIQ